MQVSRRYFFLGSLALPLLAQKKKAPPARPNVILLLADNVPQWVLGVYGNQEIKTPNLDRFAATGTRFLDAMAASPSPAPSRGSLLTGAAPGKTGATLESCLTAAGYAANPATDALGAVRIIDSAAAGKPFFAVV